MAGSSFLGWRLCKGYFLRIAAIDGLAEAGPQQSVSMHVLRQPVKITAQSGPLGSA